MKISAVVLFAALAGEAVASWGFGKAVYNKWHETELERWLSDHNIPYPSPADRKDLEKLVNDNWQTKVVNPYQEWDSPQLQSYLTDTAKELDQKRKEDKSWLVQTVQKGWHETEKTAEDAYASVRDWIFDSWTESQLKAFLDRHGIPNPNPRTRDTLLSTARENYQAVAEKLGESASYPGNWLYESWSDSDLKRFLDERGIPAPQPSTRDKLVAAVRRNSRLASHQVKYKAAQAAGTVSDSVFDSWSESSLKEFLDKNGVKIPQGSNMNELRALARRNKAYYAGDTVSESAKSAYGKATAAGADQASKATDTASQYGQAAFDKAVESWSDTRLKAYLDSRGVPVPQNGKRDELLAKVRLNKHKAANGFGAWTFDTWTYDNLKNFLEERGEKVSDNAAQSRDELYSSVAAYYSTASASAASAASVASASASSAGAEGAGKATDAAGKATDAASKATDYAADGGNAAYASLTSAVSKATATIKDATFDTWSDSDLKAYLDSYGINTYQGSTRNELVAMARRNAHYFRYGGQDQGITGQMGSGLGYVKDTLMGLLGMGKKTTQQAGNRAYEGAQAAGDRAKENAQYAYDRAKEEL